MLRHIFAAHQALFRLGSGQRCALGTCAAAKVHREVDDALPFTKNFLCVFLGPSVQGEQRFVSLNECFHLLGIEDAAWFQARVVDERLGEGGIQAKNFKLAHAELRAFMNIDDEGYVALIFIDHGVRPGRKLHEAALVVSGARRFDTLVDFACIHHFTLLDGKKTRS